ncbi:tyrosine-protein phosphatase non-receptor type 21-like [Tubulanus polymorphus]|uniref:tyrosine-protein phosphatase non-receptor type 21-like n=1 Tax=Tubulanus polymorphus TaxID=672921 RepID=UPI003DA4D9D5
MPFKLRLKRTRRYHVSSKNLYVVCVRLLDNAVIECTLTAESTGRECLENIAPRIELSELQYFGLRYFNKKLGLHWTDLDKPLKKQLEKNDHSPTLFFGVTFYVSDVHNISDEMVRYYYYLQLKSDVIEGRLPCTPEHAVLLASYSAQADFGDFLSERVGEYKQVISFPKNLSRDEQSLNELLESTLHTYGSLHGVDPTAAELQYLLEVQQLDGYGVECYPAKDESGNDLIIGASFAGIFVKQISGQSTLYFKWQDIRHLTHNKKTFGIQTALDQQTVNLHMDDPEVAKYVWRMCVLQHQFFRDDQSALISNTSLKVEPSSTNAEMTGNTDKRAVPDIQRIAQNAIPAQESPTVVEGVQPNTNLDIHYMTQGVTTQPADPSAVFEFETSQPVRNIEASSNGSVNNVSGSIYSVTQGQVVLGSQENISQRLANLPAYRPAPDYDSVMLQRHLQQQQQQQNHIQLSHSLTMGDISTTGVSNVYLQNHSQPDVAQTMQPVYSTPFIHHPTGYEYVVQTTAYAPPTHTIPANGYVPSRPVERVSSLILQPTYNCSGLRRRDQAMLNQLSTSETMITQTLLNECMKPPPPYPRFPSNSTPDLASHTIRPNLNPQPDLVSQRNIDLSQLLLAGNSQGSDAAVDDDNVAPELYNLAISNGSNSVLDTEKKIANLDITYHANDDALSAGICASELDKPEYVSESEQLNVSCPPALCLLDNVELHSDSSDESNHGMDTVRLSSAYASASGYGKNSSNSPSMKTVKAAHLKTSSNLADIHKKAGHFKTVSAPVPMIAKTEDVEATQSSKIVEQQNAAIASEMTCKKPAQENAKIPVEIADDVGHRDAVEENEEIHVKEESSNKEEISTTEQVKYRRRKEKNDDDDNDDEEAVTKRRSMGPLKMAAMNGLTISRATMMFAQNDETRAPKDDRRKTLENKVDEGQVFTEFEKIPKKVTTAECRVAQLPDNVERNRFKDVLPYDSSRVRLKPRANNPSGYINASHIRVRVKGQDMWYIAAQAPLEKTCEDFWQLVWDQDIHIIAMLTLIHELGKSKSYPYWPQTPGPKHRLIFGDYQVTLQFSNDSLCFVTNGINLQHIPSQQERLIWHLQYTDWPDHGCPEDVHGFLAFLEEVESVNRHLAIENPEIKKHPVLVHCSAGVGRAGVAILVQVMKSCLEFNQSVDVPTVLATLRGQRMHMVQTVSQYTFVYKTLIEYLKNTRLI